MSSHLFKMSNLRRKRCAICLLKTRNQLRNAYQKKIVLLIRKLRFKKCFFPVLIQLPNYLPNKNGFIQGHKNSDRVNKINRTKAILVNRSVCWLLFLFFFFWSARIYLIALQAWSSKKRGKPQRMEQRSFLSSGFNGSTYWFIPRILSDWNSKDDCLT